MILSIQPLNEANAREIAGWHYEKPYDFYNLSPDEVGQNIRYFLDPQSKFYGIFEEQEFVGYCSFGKDGQVSGGDYSVRGLDIGMGIRPDLMGQGWGNRSVAAALNFAQRRFVPPFRVTVAAFNQRAIRVWHKAGFQAVQTFEHQHQGVPFVILVRET